MTVTKTLHSHVGILPIELIEEIIEYLDTQSICRAGQTCREWRLVEQSCWKWIDLKKLFPNVKFLDKSIWNAYANTGALRIDPSDDFDPSQTKKIVKILYKFSLLPVESDAGITLLTIPKGLNFSKLLELAGSPLQGNRTRIIVSSFIGGLAYKSIKRTYRIPITNSILNGSRNLSLLEHNQLIQSCRYSFPTLLEASTLAILTYISSPIQNPIRLLSNHPKTATRCKETIKFARWNIQLKFGEFRSEGPNVGFESEKADYLGLMVTGPVILSKMAP